VLATIISFGTIAGALIPEFTKVFTSTESRHVKEVVTSSKQGGASLNILSGFVAGNFSAFWTGLVILALMFGAYHFSGNPALQAIMPEEFRFAAPIFAFGLVAFGFLGMGPVTIAVDSFGPVTDNAQSVYELSQIESPPEIGRGDREGLRLQARLRARQAPAREGRRRRQHLQGDGQARPHRDGGRRRHDDGLRHHHAPASACYPDTIERLSLVHPEAMMGLLMGGAVIYWFTGASTQAVVTGAYRAVVYIKENMKLDASTASTAASKEVVRICTQYAQKGMINIFVVVFCFALSLAFFNSYFFIGYLIGIAFFGLFQAIFMANAGGAWDNAKKIVEVELKQKGTPLHAATVVGDTVGDPFKDTSSVSLNPVIKFTTLFGLLAVEIAVKMDPSLKLGLGAAIFVGRPGLRLPQLLLDADPRGQGLGGHGLRDGALDPDGLRDDLPEDGRQPGGRGVAPPRGRDDEARGDLNPSGRRASSPPEVGLEAGVEVHRLEPDRVAPDVARGDGEGPAERDREVGVVAADALARLPDVPCRGPAVGRARR
jgi:K(+)-stimulated pyrophosphate-energized sodium pump